MSTILPYKSGKNSIVVTISLIVAIVITNSFIVFSPDEYSRSLFSNLTSTLTAGIPLAIAFVMVFRYKRSMKKQQDKSQMRSEKGTDITNYYDNNKMHLSICIFLVLWFVAHIIWTFQFQQSSDVSIQDILWFIGYGFFGYFLYSLYYHFFRKELEPLILVLIAIVISTALVFVLDTIVSILRLLSARPVYC
jgi:drug/metabolite transporter (DMT)-like permease